MLSVCVREQLSSEPAHRLFEQLLMVNYKLFKRTLLQAEAAETTLRHLVYFLSWFDVTGQSDAAVFSLTAAANHVVSFF